MAQASRDQNNVPTLLGASSVDGSTPTTVYVNPTTHRVLVDLAGAGGGITSINADTTAAQTLTTGTTGTDFAIADNAAGDHKFNLPVASGTNTGKLSNTDWTTFNNKVATSRTISTTAPLSGGGDLSANRTLTTSMATNKLIGRATAGTGVMEEITLGTNLSYTGTTLNATAGATSPGGSNGDIQINASSSFGTVGGMNVDQTGNTRGASSLDIQSQRLGVTQVASGACSVAVGLQNTASADYTVALGLGNTVSATTGIGIGVLNTASGVYGVALGRGNLAKCNPSVAVGTNNGACGVASTASGYKNTASGAYSNATGFCNTASGCCSTAFGRLNITSACNASAFGTAITNSTATSTEIGPVNTEKLRISSAGANLITAGGTYLVNGAAAFVPLTRTVNGKALSADITLGLASADFANQGTTTTVLHGNAAGNPAFGAVVEADITLADNTTNNVSTTKHGFTPKAPNDATKYLDGTGAYSVPAGTGTSVTVMPRTNFLTTSAMVQLDGSVGNTVLRVGQVVVPFAITVNKLSINANGNDGNTVKIALFSETGASRPISITTGAISANGIVTTAVSAVALSPGIYYVGLLMNGAANMNFNGYEMENTQSAALFSDGVTGEPILCGTLTVTASTMPSTIDPTAITAGVKNTLAIRLDN